jgi:hypothetical protein
LDERIIANALVEVLWRSPEVPYCGHVARKREICTAEATERSRKASPGRFQGQREILKVPWQTYTFTYTFSQLREITCFICSYLKTNAKHLKSVGLKWLWEFKSPSGHHINVETDALRSRS